MKSLIKKYYLLVLFTIIGATGGFLYWKFVGCASGACPIKSLWYLSTLYGSIFGFLIGSLLSTSIKKSQK
ncbi:MAG: hypothetical protein KBB11_00310 [Bacteroidales bacterium]|nr:hypothetical protein [Bacteroidales bacterium]HOY39827.1 DUF6132 family protein [Bacteroidales bacterium]HQP04861.1 DUF6132 family protein [Bacteroidales bacterium]